VRARGSLRHSFPRLRFLKLRFWLPYEDLHNPTRKRVDVNFDISSLTRRVMKKSQLQSLRFGLRLAAEWRCPARNLASSRHRPAETGETI
jgi:hypothetical protein